AAWEAAAERGMPSRAGSPELPTPQVQTPDATSPGPGDEDESHEAVDSVDTGVHLGVRPARPVVASTPLAPGPAIDPPPVPPVPPRRQGLSAREIRRRRCQAEAAKQQSQKSNHLCHSVGRKAPTEE